MSDAREEIIQPPVPRGMARHANMAGLNIPVWHFIWVFGIPALVVIATGNPLWLLLVPLLVWVSRQLVGEDKFQARCWFMGALSGAFCGRRRGGVHTVPAITPRKKWQGLLHG